MSPKSALNYQTNTIRLDCTLKDSLRQDWDYWESKDEADNLDREIEKKFAKGYPKGNILFKDSKTAILIRNGEQIMCTSMKDEVRLDGLFSYKICVF